MLVNGNDKEIHLSFYELINKMKYNPPKKIYIMTTDIPEEQRYCTYDESNMVYRQDYNNSLLAIPVGLGIYIDSVKVLDDFDPLKTLFEVGRVK